MNLLRRIGIISKNKTHVSEEYKKKFNELMDGLDFLVDGESYGLSMEVLCIKLTLLAIESKLDKEIFLSAVSFAYDFYKEQYDDN